MKPVPCRLNIVRGPNKDKVVILRRGPTHWTRMILWDLKTDRLEYGQWIKNGLKPALCDLSPDGEFVLYSVSYHRTRKPYNWVALSRPPYLTALAMWEISDAWGGDATFLSNDSLMITPGGGQEAVSLSPGFVNPNFKEVRWERDRVVNKNVRNGWKFCGSTTRPYRNEYQKLNPENPQQKLVRSDKETKLYDGETEISLKLRDADWQPDGSIIATTQQGQICRIDVRRDFKTKILADLNDMKPESIVAPAWAKSWTQRKPKASKIK